jgi:glutamate:GABA antiporter
VTQLSKPAVAVEQTTTLALVERSKLVKALRRFDMVFFTVCAFVGLDTLGAVASNGAQGFMWLVLVAIVPSARRPAPPDHA